MTSKHQYEAFISYSHTDKAMAVWLQRSLERLRIPRHIASLQGRASNRFRPVFRDEDELTTSVDLPETLRNVLSDSRNLIVICSPAAAQSPWVEQEVSSFRGLGDPTRVFCVLVGGDPDQLESCFPPSLREGGVPLAVDLRPDGEQRSIGLLRIAAWRHTGIRSPAPTSNKHLKPQSCLTLVTPSLAHCIVCRAITTPGPACTKQPVPRRWSETNNHPD